MKSPCQCVATFNDLPSSSQAQMGRLAKDNWKPTVNVVTWFLMTTTILCVLTRLGTKYWIFRRWTTDDYLSIFSVVLCAAQSIALSMATAHGYGEHYDALSGTAVDSILKVSCSCFSISSHHSYLASPSKLQLFSLFRLCVSRNYSSSSSSGA